MGRRNSVERWNARSRHLVYDGIKIVPVDNGQYPYTNFPDSWHVPGWGNRWATTKELTRLATRRRVTLRLVEMTPGGVVTSTILN